MGIKCGIVGLPNVGKSTLFNALTAAEIPAENYPFCTIDPNVGVVTVPDPKLDALAADREAGESRADRRRVRRHRGPRRGRIARPGAGQPIPRAHSRDARDRAPRALLRERRHRARRRQDQPAARHRDHRHRADAGGLGVGAEGPSTSGEGGEDQRQGGCRAPRRLEDAADGARERQTRAHRRAARERGRHPEGAAPHHGQARDVHRQRGRGLTRGESARRCGAQARGRARRGGRRHLGCDRSRARAAARSRSARSS